MQVGEEEVCSERWWFEKLDQGIEIKGDSKITTDKHCIFSNWFSRGLTTMRGMPARLSWRWGTFRTKSSSSVLLFVRRRSTRRTSPRGKQLWSRSSFLSGGIGNQTKKQKNKEGLAVRCQINLSPKLTTKQKQSLGKIDTSFSGRLKECVQSLKTIVTRKPNFFILFALKHTQGQG